MRHLEGLVAFGNQLCLLVLQVVDACKLRLQGLEILAELLDCVLVGRLLGLGKTGVANRVAGIGGCPGDVADVGLAQNLGEVTGTIRKLGVVRLEGGEVLRCIAESLDILVVKGAILGDAAGISLADIQQAENLVELALQVVVPGDSCADKCGERLQAAGILVEIVEDGRLRALVNGALQGDCDLFNDVRDDLVPLVDNVLRQVFEWGGRLCGGSGLALSGLPAEGAGLLSVGDAEGKLV